MSHLSKRFCLVPFYELADSPAIGHHAIGSPYFDPTGRPLFSDPIAIAVRADLFDKRLPRCSATVVSCNTKPYHSYGPVMRRVFEESRPHEHPEVRQGFEGVMEVGTIREIPPGALIEQSEKIVLACVTTVTGNTNRQILENVLSRLGEYFAGCPGGSTMRMPIIGTGKAIQEKATEEIYRNVANSTLAHFQDALLPANSRVTPRRLLLIHPFEYEAQLIATALAEKAIFLSILDKMQLTTTDPRLVYGMALGEEDTPRAAKFSEALDHFDLSLDRLLAGKRKEALQEAARGAEAEPDLSGMYMYIAGLTQRRGLLDAVTKEALGLAASGRVRDAYCVAHTLLPMGGKGNEKKLVSSLKDCYLDYCVTSLEARLLYEHYMQAEEGLLRLRQGIDFGEKSATVPTDLISDMKPLEYLEQKISARIAENTFHLVIRKFLADAIEVSGVKRSLDNLRDLQTHGKIALSPGEENVCRELDRLSDWVQREQDNIPDIHRRVLTELLAILPDHGTLCLEAARYYLKGRETRERRAVSLSRLEIEKAWEFLDHGYEKNSRDYGILSYLGFLIMLQGHKYLHLAEDFYTLFSKLIGDELTQGKYSIRKVRSPQGDDVSVSLRDPHTKMAYHYYSEYSESARLFGKLAGAIRSSEGTAAVALYQRAIQSLERIGRSDLAMLYEDILGETWVALLCRNQQHLGSIPLPIGEISLDLIFNFCRKLRYWWKYKNIKSDKVRKAISELVKKLGKRIAAK